MAQDLQIFQEPQETQQHQNTHSSNADHNLVPGTLINNLVSFWRFEENSGTRYDSYANNHLLETTPISRDNGKVGKCLSLGAADDVKLEVPFNISLELSVVAQVTMAVWVNAPTDEAEMSIGRSNQYYTLANSGLFVPAFYIRNTAAQDGSPIHGTGWHFLIGTYSRSSRVLTLHVDNVQVDFSIQTYMQGAFPFSVGGKNILIDELGVWKRVLNATERTWLYNNGDGRTFNEVYTHNS